MGRVNDPVLDFCASILCFVAAIVALAAAGSGALLECFWAGIGAAVFFGAAGVWFGWRM